MQALERHARESPDLDQAESHRAEEFADALPVLNAVVRTGNASIIESHRLGHQVLGELETLQRPLHPAQRVEGNPAEQSLPDRFSLLDDLAGSFDQTLDFEQPDFAPELDAGFSTGSADSSMTDDQIELMVDALVDRHVSELRRDIRSLLAQARGLSVRASSTQGPATTLPR